MKLEFVLLAVLLIAIITLLGTRVRFLSRRNAWLQDQLDAYRHTGRHRAPSTVAERLRKSGSYGKE